MGKKLGTYQFNNGFYERAFKHISEGLSQVSRKMLWDGGDITSIEFRWNEEDEELSKEIQKILQKILELDKQLNLLQ